MSVRREGVWLVVGQKLCITSECSVQITCLLLDVQNSTEVGKDSFFDVTINSSMEHNPRNFPDGPCASEDNPTAVPLITRVSLSEAVYDPNTNLYVFVLGNVCVSMDTNYTVDIAYTPDDTGPPAVYVDRVRDWSHSECLLAGSCDLPYPRAPVGF